MIDAGEIAFAVAMFVQNNKVEFNRLFCNFNTVNLQLRLFF